MNNSNNNNWITENPLLKNKNQRYYYDFGTGKQIEREEVKEKREAFLKAVNGISNEPKKQEKDDFLEGFDDPYGEKREQERQQKEQERKEKFANIRANADKRTWASQNDPFLDGFNGTSNEQRVNFPNTHLQTKPQDYGLRFPNTEFQAKPPMFPNTQIHAKAQNQDAIEFGENSETYKILQDLSKKWYDTSDSAEKDRLHEVAEEVRRLARGNNQVKYGTDEIFDVMHRNAKIGQLVKGASLGTIPIKSALTNPLLAGVSGNLLEPGAFLTAMTDYGPWDYKRKDYWRVGGEEGKRLKVFDGKDLDADNNRNWLPWIYFDGYLIGADKFGNMNMAYVGKKMDLPEWVYKNFETMDDPKDIFWIDKGIELAESGR